MLMLLLLGVEEDVIVAYKGDCTRLWGAVCHHPKRHILLQNNNGKRWRKKVRATLLKLSDKDASVALAWDAIDCTWGSWTSAEKASRRLQRSGGPSADASTAATRGAAAAPVKKRKHTPKRRTHLTEDGADNQKRHNFWWRKTCIGP
eukprot:COSAG02_NODE_29745_length_563_cov_193.420259_1_plen_146_part_10